MAFQSIDAIDSAGGWSVHEADGSPSTELSVSTSTTVRYAGQSSSLQIIGSTNAGGHYAQGSVPAFDLDTFDELRLYLRGDRRGDGHTAPPYLQVQLASSTVGFDDPTNTWSRRLPVAPDGAWQTVRLTVHDVPPALQTGVNALRVTCTDAALPFACTMHTLLAVREEMVQDVEDTLVAWLDGAMTLDGAPVPAVVHHEVPGETRSVVPIGQRPRIRLIPYDLQPADEMLHRHTVQQDYTGDGYSLAPEADVFQLHYQAEFHTESRAQQAALLEFMLDVLTPQAALVVAGLERPVRAVYPEALRRENGPYAAHSSVQFVVTTRRERTRPIPVVPVNEVILETDALD